MIRTGCCCSESFWRKFNFQAQLSPHQIIWIRMYSELTFATCSASQNLTWIRPDELGRFEDINLSSLLGKKLCILVDLAQPEVGPFITH